jgi:hypothetical protein
MSEVVESAKNNSFGAGKYFQVLPLTFENSRRSAICDLLDTLHAGYYSRNFTSLANKLGRSLSFSMSPCLSPSLSTASSDEIMSWSTRFAYNFPCRLPIMGAPWQVPREVTWRGPAALGLVYRRRPFVTCPSWIFEIAFFS